MDNSSGKECEPVSLSPAVCDWGIHDYTHLRFCLFVLRF